MQGIWNELDWVMGFNLVQVLRLHCCIQKRKKEQKLRGDFWEEAETRAEYLRVLGGCFSHGAVPCIIHQLSKLPLNPLWWLWEGVRLGSERGGNKEPCEFFTPIIGQLARHAPGCSRAFLAFLEQCLMLDPDAPVDICFPF